MNELLVEMNFIIRRIRGLLIRRPMNFSFINDYVCGSSVPTSRSQVKWLRERGVMGVLSLTTAPLRKDWLSGLDYLSIPIKDHTIPTVEEIEQSIDFILQHEERKEKVLVHCYAGKGRTGTVLAAYLCRKYGFAPEQAILFLRTKRSGSVERAQRKVVEEYWDQLVSSKRERSEVRSAKSEIIDRIDQG